MKGIPTLLAKNLQVLEKAQPKLVSHLRKYLDELLVLKEPVFQETSAGRWVSGLAEKPFFERRNLLEKRGKTTPSAVYLVFGAGCAPYLFHVLRSLPREALSVIIVEPSFDLLLHTLSQTSVFQALPAGCRISFLVDGERPLIDEAFAWNVVPIGIFPVSKAVVLSHDGEAETVDFHLIADAFRKEIIYRLTLLGNAPEDTLLGLRHAALNTPRILRSPKVGELEDCYGGKPFVCVASGPSLEKNVHLLNDIQDKCVIVACDTVLFHLLERGIVPHIVTTIERPYTTYDAWVPLVLAKYREQCGKILLLSQSVSYPLIAGRWPGANIVVGKLDVPVDNWYMGAILGEQLMYSGLSVSHMALSFALACKAPSVALIGQDLAYGEEGHSHASHTVPDSALAVEQKRRQSAISVPGSLGGFVSTSAIWLTFIQIFERLIAANKSTPVHDCTEGGALIKGTEVTPFRDYINDNILAPDVCVSRWKSAATGKKISYDDILDHFGKAFSQLDRLDARLAEMRSEVARCAAPALAPAKRQSIAFSVAGILDGIHTMNPVISFIGQSYTHLSGTILAENRFLETVEQVERWRTLHEEIVESHSYAVAFLRQWLQYARNLTENMRRGSLAGGDGVPGNGEAAFLAFFDVWKENEENGALPDQRNTALIQLADVLSCKDPLQEDWTPDGLWKAGLVFFDRGRAEEGRRCMAKAYEMMEGAEVPARTMGMFFKDWGKMAAAHDLCALPLAADAMTLFANAKEYLSDDEEIALLQKDALRRQKSFYKEAAKVKANRNEEVRLLLLRNEAENALLEKDLPSALRTVEEFVLESLDAYPGTAIPHLQWLMKTTAVCAEASDKDLARLSAGILDRIISGLPKLIERRIDFPAEFLSHMAKKGIKFSVETSDNKTEKG